MQPPRGYRGVDHETLGSDILAVDRGLCALAPSPATRRALLGPELFDWLQTVDRDTWYPVERLLDLLEHVGNRAGRYALIKVGRLVFEMGHREYVAQRVTDARSLLVGMDTLYRAMNRGQDIGGWRLLEFDRHGALLEKTTPHHCAMEEGILAEALTAIDAPSVISQQVCRRDSGDVCLFVVSPVTASARWYRETSP